MPSLLNQLSPADRLYVSRLIQKNSTLLGLANRENSPNLEDLIPKDDNGVSVLQRLIQIHQGLSSQGNHFAEDARKLEWQILTRLQWGPDGMPTQLTVSSGPESIAPPSPELAIETSAPQTLELYLSGLNQLSQLSQRYLGTKFVTTCLQASRPASPWLSQLEIAPNGQIHLQGTGQTSLTQEQVHILQQWGNEFIRRCSSVIRHFAQLVGEAGLEFTAGLKV